MEVRRRTPAGEEHATKLGETLRGCRGGSVLPTAHATPRVGAGAQAVDPHCCRTSTEAGALTTDRRPSVRKPTAADDRSAEREQPSSRSAEAPETAIATAHMKSCSPAIQRRSVERPRAAPWSTRSWKTKRWNSIPCPTTSSAISEAAGDRRTGAGRRNPRRRQRLQRALGPEDRRRRRRRSGRRRRARREHLRRRRSRRSGRGRRRQEEETNGRAELRAASPTVAYQQRQTERPGYDRRYRDREPAWRRPRRNVRTRPNAQPQSAAHHRPAEGRAGSADPDCQGAHRQEGRAHHQPHRAARAASWCTCRR